MIVHLAQHFWNIFIILYLLTNNWCHVPNNNSPRVFPFHRKTNKGIILLDTITFGNPFRLFRALFENWTRFHLSILYIYMRNTITSPWPPVANLEPSGWISTENIGRPKKWRIKMFIPWKRHYDTFRKEKIGTYKTQNRLRHPCIHSKQ